MSPFRQKTVSRDLIGFLFLTFLLATGISHAASTGDVNNDNTVDLTDVVRSLRISSGMPDVIPFVNEADVGADKKVTVHEAVYGLQNVAGLTGNDEPFSFIVFGDFNGGGCNRNSRVEQIVNDMAQQQDISFFISTGDLIDGYQQSDGSATCFASNPSTNSSSSTVCSPEGNMAAILSPIKNRTPLPGLMASFYPVVGNHDDNWGSGWYPDPCGEGICDFLSPLGPASYLNHAHGDVCSTTRNSSRFSRDFYYSFAYKNSYFIILRVNNDYDTMLSSCNTHPGYSDCVSYCSDPGLFDDPSRNDSCWGGVEQYEWYLDELTKAQSYEHIFVFSHAVALGSGDNHGPYAGAEKIREMAENSGVDIYFNGHNHAYERSHPVKGSQIDQTGTVYITTGVAGAEYDYNTPDWFTAATYRKWLPSSTNADKMASYIKISVDKDQVRGEVISPATQNTPVDQFAVPATSAPLLGGCQIFPENSIWNTPVNTLPLHPSSSTYINSIGANTALHPDFGTEWNGIDIGIPFDIVPASQTAEPVIFQWADESDLGDTSTCNTGGNSSTACYPIPVNASIEGGSDHHIILLQQGSCRLYEIFDAEYSGGDWSGASGAIWDMHINQVRPLNFTSADAAGLPILPGLLRYEEVYGPEEINHVIRITMSTIQGGYIWPASHSDGQGGNDPSRPPMGLQMRLKAGYDISTYSAANQKILRALKKYGVIIADTGGQMFMSGTHHDSWDDSDLHNLKNLTASDFEVVDTSQSVVPYPCSGGGCPSSWPLSY